MKKALDLIEKMLLHKKQAEDVKLIDIHREKSYYIEDLLQIMKILRGEGGCPWDAEQDHHSIRNNFIEETYEVADAIDRDDTEALKEELGDVCLQVVFHARMEEGEGYILVFRRYRQDMQKADRAPSSCFRRCQGFFHRRRFKQLG